MAVTVLANIQTGPDNAAKMAAQGILLRILRIPSKYCECAVLYCSLVREGSGTRHYTVHVCIYNYAHVNSNHK